MTVDPKCYALAQTWLANDGWTYTGDIQRLAEQIQEVCEAFQAELEALDQEALHD